MPDKIPPVDPDLSQRDPTRDKRREELEFELLEAEAKLKQLAHREIGQRYVIKWVAVVSGVLVIIGMACALTHLVHKVFWGPFVFASPAFTVAMIVAPIASITTITVALFVGAFRRFEDKDLESFGNGVNAGASVFRGG
ncbi:hypothetical protein [Pseudooceanicola atlanticus]|uniref:hypothetical protein n=1 Tax=Pseudooceanicola atlanticus TaxID=1461694 RepID=UPI0023540B5A|nr:hypothetical protein [Pseudooceanicola atlanticus]